MVGWGAFALAIGFIDFATEPLIGRRELPLFYLVPVAVAAWRSGRAAGIVVAVATGAASLGAYILLFPQSSDIPVVWNSGSRIVLLVIAAVAIDVLRRDRARLQAVDTQRTHSLELLDRGLAAPARQIANLIEEWDGDVDGLKQVLRPRAEEISFLAREFSTMIRLQDGDLALSMTTFDLGALIDELRAEHIAWRKIVMVRPTTPLLVVGDRARARQALSALLALSGLDADVSVNLRSRERIGEAVITLADRANAQGPNMTSEEVGLHIELAQMLFVAQGGSVAVDRNELTRTSRVTARLPLA